MSAMQCNKGKAGEREAADLVRQHTGWDVRRRVRQHDGDTDLEGVPCWAVEVKRHRTALPGDVARWWAQAVAQAAKASPALLPVLLYRANRAEWRAVWPLWVLLAGPKGECRAGIEWTADTTVQSWAAVAREVVQVAVEDDADKSAPSPPLSDGQELPKYKVAADTGINKDLFGLAWKRAAIPADQEGVATCART